MIVFVVEREGESRQIIFWWYSKVDVVSNNILVVRFFRRSTTGRYC